MLPDKKVVNNSHGWPEMTIGLDHATVQGNPESYNRTDIVKTFFHIRIDQNKIIESAYESCFMNEKCKALFDDSDSDLFAKSSFHIKNKRSTCKSKKLCLQDV